MTDEQWSIEQNERRALVRSGWLTAVSTALNAVFAGLAAAAAVASWFQSGG